MCTDYLLIFIWNLIHRNGFPFVYNLHIFITIPQEGSQPFLKRSREEDKQIWWSTRVHIAQNIEDAVEHSGLHLFDLYLY